MSRVVLPLTVVLVMVSVPVLKTPPPLLRVAVLPLTVLLDRVSVPLLKMPPPLEFALLPVTVMWVRNWSRQRRNSSRCIELCLPSTCST